MATTCDEGSGNYWYHDGKRYPLTNEGVPAGAGRALEYEPSGAVLGENEGVPAVNHLCRPGDRYCPHKPACKRG